MTRRLALVVAVLAVAAPAALASEQSPTLAELERELVCPTCDTTLAMSNAPIAERMRADIRERIEAGQTKSEIKAGRSSQVRPPSALLATGQGQSSSVARRVVPSAPLVRTTRGREAPMPRPVARHVAPRSVL